MVAGRRADGELGRHYQLNVAALQGFIAGLHNAAPPDRSGLFHERPVEGDHGLTAQTTRRPSTASCPTGWPEPTQHLRRRAELHERWLHRRDAEPRAVPDRPARRRPALSWHTLTTSLTCPTSEARRRGGRRPAVRGLEGSPAGDDRAGSHELVERLAEDGHLAVEEVDVSW